MAQIRGLTTGKRVVPQQKIRQETTGNPHLREAYRLGLEGASMPQWIRSDAQYRRRWVDQSDWIQIDGQGGRARRTAGYFEVSHVMPGPYLKAYRAGLKRAGHGIPSLSKHIAVSGGETHTDKYVEREIHARQKAALEAALRSMGLPVNAQTMNLARG